MEEFGNSWADWIILFALALWTLPWKGVALWRAAKRDEKKWFVALLLFNTLALLEIVYIFVFSKRKQNVEARKLEVVS